MNEIDELQGKIDAMEAQTGTQYYNENKLNAWKARLTELQATQAKQEEFKQEQAEDLDNIILPHNYDNLWARTGINAEMQNLLRQAKEQMYNLMNQKLAETHAEYKAKLTDLHQNNDELTLALEDAVENSISLEKEKDLLGEKFFNETKLRIDAEQKRDNTAQLIREADAERDKAVKESKALKEQVNELESMLSQYKRAGNSNKGFSLSLTSTIAEKPAETSEERTARLRAEEVERTNKNLSRFGVTPLPIPATDQQIKEQSLKVEEAADEAERFQEVVSSDGAGQEAPEGTRDAVADAGAEAAQTLEDRVAALEAWKKRMEGMNFAIEQDGAA